MCFITANIIKAISENVEGSFVFNEKIKQGYDENCFLVKLQSGKLEKHLKDTYINYYDYLITYYNTEGLEDIIDKLYVALKTIRDVKINKLEFDISDNKIEFVVGMTSFLAKEDTCESMSKIVFK